MKILLAADTLEQISAFLKNCEDAEEISEGEWVVDLYEPNLLSLELALLPDGVDILAAGRLAYDAAMDGYYLADRIEQRETILHIINEMADKAHDETDK